MRLNASFKKGNKKIGVDLLLFSWDEGGIHYSYSPALDLTGYGYSEKEAKDSFEEVLKQFVEYSQNKNTIYDELEKLGWTVNKIKKRVKSPDISEMLIDNEQFREIYNKAGVKKETKELAL